MKITQIRRRKEEEADKEGDHSGQICTIIAAKKVQCRKIKQCITNLQQQNMQKSKKNITLNIFFK